MASAHRGTAVVLIEPAKLRSERLHAARNGEEMTGTDWLPRQHRLALEIDRHASLA